MIIEIKPKKSSMAAIKIRLDTNHIEYVYQRDDSVIFVVFSGGRFEWFEGITMEELLPIDKPEKAFAIGFDTGEENEGEV